MRITHTHLHVAALAFGAFITVSPMVNAHGGSYVPPVPGPSPPPPNPTPNPTPPGPATPHHHPPSGPTTPSPPHGPVSPPSTVPPGPITPPPSGGGPTTPPPVGGGPVTPVSPPTTPSLPRPGGGPSTPGPTTPSPQSPTPRTGGPIPGPAPTPTPSPMTGGLPSGPNLESWTYWWSFNKERFLKLNERIAAVEASGTVATDPESNNKNSRSNMRPSRQQLESEVVPVLLDILQKESDPLIVASAMLSAAEIAEKPDDVLESLKRLAGSGNANISENAALAMGILGTAPSIETLKTIFEDSEAGRQLCGRKNEVPWRVRTNAAYGLGLAAANTNNPHHQKTAREILLKSLAGISGGRKSHDDIGVAVILALSMFTDADSSAAAALEKFFNENREKLDLITSHVPPAIGKLLMRASSADRERYARSLVALSRADSNPPSRLARCGMGIALGLITNSADAFAADIVKELRVSVEERISKFPEAAYLSVISLGEIAGSGAPGGEIEKFLAARASADGGRVTTRTWAAIALGVEGFLQIERGMFTSKDDISTSLELKMLEVKDPEQKSAFAIALGLRHCAAADKSLLKCLQSVRVDEQRGYFALALGMIGATAQSPAIQQIVKDSGRRPGFLQQAVIGLAVMGDKGAVPLLIQMMRDEHLQSSAVQAAAADALGFVGDYRAVGPLLEFAKNDRNDRTTLTRTFAIVALGLVGDRASQRWYARISEQLNYIAFVETLTDLVWEQ